MENEWKGIPGFEDKWLINNKGEVYSIAKKCLKNKSINKEGYEIIYTGGRPRKLSIHRLVGELFVLNPNNKPILHHIDGNKLNNNADNLMWVTDKEHHILHGHKIFERELKLDIPKRLPGETYAQFSRRKLNIIK